LERDRSLFQHLTKKQIGVIMGKCPICHKGELKLLIKKKKFFCPECLNLIPAVEKGGFYRIKLSR